MWWTRDRCVESGRGSVCWEWEGQCVLGVGGQLYRWEEVQVCSVGDVGCLRYVSGGGGAAPLGEGQLYWREGQG